MKRTLRLTPIALFTTVLLLQACAAAVVSDANKDTTGNYDGKWNATILKPAALQYVGNWTVPCEQSEFSIEMSVASGEVFINKFGSQETTSTYINSNGNFVFEIPMENEVSESAASSTSLADGRTKIFFRGNLGEKTPSGSFEVGIADLGWRGCYTKVVFENKSKPNNAS